MCCLIRFPGGRRYVISMSCPVCSARWQRFHAAAEPPQIIVDASTGEQAAPDEQNPTWFVFLMNVSEKPAGPRPGGRVVNRVFAHLQPVCQRPLGRAPGLRPRSQTSAAPVQERRMADMLQVTIPTAGHCSKYTPVCVSGPG